MRKIICLIAVVLIAVMVFGQEKDLIEETTKEQYVPKVIIEAKVGNGEGEFGIVSGLHDVPRGPNALTVDKECNIYVLDPVNRRILKFNKDGKYLKTINLEQKKIKIKTKHPARLAAETNPTAFKVMFGNKKPEDFPEYEEKKVLANPFPIEIKIDKEGKIYGCSGASFPEQYVICIYDQDGKIIDGYTMEEIGEGFKYRLNIDDNGTIRFIIAEKLTVGKESPPYGVEIDSKRRKIKKIDLTKVDEKIKIEKFRYGETARNMMKIQDLSSLPKLEKLIKKSRSEFCGYIETDNEGNIYELVWAVPPAFFNEVKGITKIVWNKKTLPEGVKVIKWKKVK